MGTKKQPPSALRIVDIARLAGVAPITVSRVLNQPEQVKPATRERVQKAIAKTGFVPNQNAGALASKRSRLVAVVLPMLTNPLFSETFQAITERLAQSGYQVLLGVAGYETRQEQELLDLILSRRPDGIILTGTFHSDACRQRLRAMHIPVVETWDVSDDPIDMLVGFSHREVGIATADHLLAQGYQRFGVLSVDDPRGLLRAQALVETLRNRGITDISEHYFSGQPTLAQGREGLLRIRQQDALLRVIVCTSDTIAQGVLTEAASVGLTVPGEVAVFGFGDMNFAAHTWPPLSTVRIDGRLIGEQSASALLQRLSGENESNFRLDVGFTLIDRGTTSKLS